MEHRSLLDKYLSDRRITARDFARDANLPEFTLSRIRSGARAPTLAQAVAIERASGGCVPVECWIDEAAA